MNRLRGWLTNLVDVAAGLRAMQRAGIARHSPGSLLCAAKALHAFGMSLLGSPLPIRYCMANATSYTTNSVPSRTVNSTGVPMRWVGHSVNTDSLRATASA